MIQLENSKDSAYSPNHSYDLLQWKDTKQNQQREKFPVVKSGGKQAQASKGPLPGKLKKKKRETYAISTATSCDNMCEVLSTREAL